MNDNTSIDREAWLTLAADEILENIIEPQLPAGFENERDFRISVGYPPRSTARSKVIAVCIKSCASAAGLNEMFITPALDDSLEILAALTHELIHFSDDCASGHKNFFAKTARAVGLEGKLTATKAGAKLEDRLADIIANIGNIPHSKIDLGLAKQKQSTRMLKVACPDDACGFAYRASHTQIAKVKIFTCPACDNHEMVADV